MIGLTNGIEGFRTLLYKGGAESYLDHALTQYRQSFFIMGSTTNPLVMDIQNVLRRGINDLIDDTESFCTLVSDLQDEAAELTPSERRFLDYLVPFRDKLVRDAPVIASVECAEAQSQEELSVILDKSCNIPTPKII
jgi:hypothetical protein